MHRRSVDNLRSTCQKSAIFYNQIECDFQVCNKVYCFPTIKSARMSRKKSRVVIVEPRQWGERQDKERDFKLLHACTMRHVPLAKRALEQGARVSCRRSDSLAPLHIAAEHGDVELINLLCDQPEINVEIKTMHGLTPLHTSILLGHAGATKTLLNRGAAVDAEDNLKRYPLHYAALQRDSEVARILIECEANVNVYDAFEETPLYTSVMRRPCTSMMKLLLHHGAAATLAPRNESLGLLLEAVLSAREASSMEVVEFLLEHCSDVNLRDPIGLRTPLHFTGISGNTVLTAYLMRRGGDLRARNLSGKTPLEVARLYRNYRVARLMENFLKNSIDVMDDAMPSTSGIRD